MTTERADLLVVGAGPVGLAAAVAAARAGLQVVVIDRARRAALHSYALALHPSSLRLLTDWELTEELLPIGRRIEGTTIHGDGAELGRFSLDRLDVDHPFALSLGQPWLEGALERSLEHFGVAVLWHHQLLSLGQNKDEVSAIVAPVGELEPDVDPASVGAMTLRARYLLGADGGESTVRRLLDIESICSDRIAAYRLIEFEPEGALAASQQLVLDGEFMHGLWPLARERARWSLQFDGPEDGRPPGSAIETMRRHGDWVSSALHVHWDTTVRFDRRLARGLGRGRVWIAGDAGRVCRPLAAHAMNAGLLEASRFVDAIAGDGDIAAQLAIWSDEVRAAWRGLLEPERRLTFDDDAPAWARKHATRLIDALPANGADLVALLAQQGIRYNWL